MSEEKEQPIIVIRKKVYAAGHHGGAWKVAYADFVTAMMALFIVLWLLNTSEEVQEAIGAYFNDPSGAGQAKGSGQAGSGSGIEVAADNMDQLKIMLDQALKQSPRFEQLQDYVQMSVTGEGLRIEMLESEQGMFFRSGSPVPSEEGEYVISLLAEELADLPNNIVIEGHTDARPFGGRDNYSNWELSADRANSARRIMEAKSLRPGQVVQIRGFADQDLRNPSNPYSAANRRISVIVRYQNPPQGKEPSARESVESGSGEQHEPLSLGLGEQDTEAEPAEPEAEH